MTSADDLLLFVDEDQSPSGNPQVGWLVLIVDDDPDVHQATELALRGLQIEQRPLQLLHAHSGAEAARLLQQNPDIAVLLLDVVMESDDAGLQLVQRIRHELNNPLVRIILRTGQPGYAPEMNTIRDYDINDYKTKSELTRTRLFTSLTTAIRTYRQMREQAEMRRGLETVVRASTELTRLQGMQRFADGVVRQLSVLLGVSPEGLICAEDGDDSGAPARVIAAAGQFGHLVNEPLHNLPAPVHQLLSRCLQQRSSLFEQGLALYFPTDSQRGLAAYLELQRPLQETDQHLLQVFCSSMSAGFDNVMLYSRMNEQTYTDPLLHIPNMNQLLEWLRDPQQVRDGRTLAILDLDDFAAINDTLGHSFGDELLQAVYQRLQQHLADCLLARIGSDIFALLGPEEHITPEILTELFSSAFPVGQQPVRLSATSGLVQLNGRCANGSEILKDAHLVLKQTKLTQRGSANYFSPKLGQQARERMRLMTALREAFNQTQLFLMYQPKIDLRNGKTSGFEALLRWRNNEGDMIPPDRFIPLAEKSGLIIALGYFVLRQACACLFRLRQQGHNNLTMAINVSQVQLRETDFTEQLQQIVQDSQVPAEAIELEITESVAAEDFNFLVQRLNEIRALGFGIAIDDFGTGFSSLGVLRHLPATRLKIDRVFINEMHSDDSIARMVISLGHSLAMQITAEGVETSEQQQKLQQLGCDEGQGWLYAPALPEKELPDWLVTPAPAG